MDDGREQFYLVSTDLCLFSPSVYDDVAAELKAQAGIDAEAVLVVGDAHAFSARSGPLVAYTMRCSRAGRITNGIASTRSKSSRR